MTAHVLIDAFQIPAEARVDQRVPKKLLTEQGAPTAADKRAIQDGIEEILWIAALKPTNIGIPEFRDETREYVETAMLEVTLRSEAKVSRLIELFHRAIPYPLVLLVTHGGGCAVSLAHKRWSQGETGKTVVEAIIVSPNISTGSLSAIDQQFLATLPLARQPAASLYTVYQGWIHQLEALAAAQIAGRFIPLSQNDALTRRRAALAEYQRLDREITQLRGEAIRESQVNRRVDLNLRIQRLELQQKRELDNF